MEDNSQDFDLIRSQKSRLLSLSLGSKPLCPRIGEDEQRMDMLYDVLNQTLPVDPTVVDSLPTVVKSLSSGLKSLAGRPIGDLIQDPKTAITTINRIKQYAKDAGISANSEAESDIFMAVYYGAIASALLFKHTKITQHSDEDLQKFFLSFSKQAWVLDEVKGLFRKACVHCERIAGKADSPRE